MASRSTKLARPRGSTPASRGRITTSSGVRIGVGPERLVNRLQITDPGDLLARKVGRELIPASSGALLFFSPDLLPPSTIT